MNIQTLIASLRKSGNDLSQDATFIVNNEQHKAITVNSYMGKTIIVTEKVGAPAIEAKDDVKKETEDDEAQD